MNRLSDGPAVAAVAVSADVVPEPGGMRASRPWPLGVHLRPGEVHVALWAPEATAVWFCVFDDAGEHERHRLAVTACDDGVWHGLWPWPDGQALTCGWRVDGPWDPSRGWRHNPHKLLLDPHAPELVGRFESRYPEHFGHEHSDGRQRDTQDNAARALKGRVRPVDSASGLHAWPGVPWDRTVLYEVHVKGATQLHPQVPPHLRGTYRGLAHPAMVAHWRRLGVTTLSLLPVHAHVDEPRLQAQGLSNHWGYNTVSFFAPHPEYAVDPTQAVDEFRDMVVDLHAAGLEVVLDVVFNHTAESDELGPMFHLRGQCNRQAYRHESEGSGRYVNWSGCGNTLNLSEPRVVQMVVASLRHWVQVYGVDGFRFDLAPILGRGPDGRFDRRNAFFAALASDPVLAGVKWIAEPWDLGPDGYQLGGFPPGWGEWNDQFRDTTRSWWLRRAGDRAAFVHRFAASSRQFCHSGRAPTASVNFITAHDGFTLRDLVSHNHKHNLANGEGNRDGHHHNNSWNCGVEGATDDPCVLEVRARLSRALLACLLLSQGTPMLLGGDEVGHSQQGNNNAYCQDNAITWIDWSKGDASLTEWVATLLALRREHPALRMPRWWTGLPDADGRIDVQWLHPQGRPLEGDDWHGHRQDRGVGILLQCASDRVLILVHPDETDLNWHLPPGRWVCQACSVSGDRPAGQALSGEVTVPARSVQVWLPEFPFSSQPD